MKGLDLLKKKLSKLRIEDSEDEQAETIARGYGLEKEYWLSRKHGRTPSEALGDWDLPDFQSVSKTP